MDKEQFQNSVIILQDKMFRYAISLVFDIEAAKDIVQEVLLKLWKQKDELAEKANLEAWCIRLIRNTSIDRLRSPKNQTIGLETVGSHFAQGIVPDQHSEQGDLVQNIYQLMKDLPEQQREIFRLREILGYSNAEIEELMLLNESQVKVNLFRARQKIKHRLTKLINYGLTK